LENKEYTMSQHIIKAVVETNMSLSKSASAKPTTPSGGLLSRTGERATNNMNTQDNITSYVKQIREARKTYA
tara:strand:- start:1177 stop:1392 length:216 start_codon:yes stop_codon:yes gene_type:complete